MKIGIITQYYKSNNYGGNLQAFALCEYLNRNGYEAEQISYDMQSGLKPQSFVGKAKRLVKKSIRALKKGYTFGFQRAVFDGMERRKKAMAAFNQSIPHSKRIYDEKNIASANSIYDAFVAGSDQIWLPQSLDTAFFLNFANEDKRKISYAASLSVAALTDRQTERYAENLQNIDCISVREQRGVELLDGLTDKTVRLVVDPVFLLEKADWEEYCPPKCITENYVICYFLGNDEQMRKLAVEYARSRKLKIVTMPHLHGKLQKEDLNYGDVELYDVSPSEFVSLIKHAAMVFTDSFHAMAFSIIFHKEYVVFERNNSGFGSRIDNLSKLAKHTERFLNSADRRTLSYIESLEPLKYEDNMGDLCSAIEESKEFLTNSLTK